MKTATTFHSEFFNTDCIVIDGTPWFTITGATKTLYPGSSNTKALKAQLSKVLGSPNPVTAIDLAGDPRICGVTIEADGSRKGATREGVAISQELFKALLWEYQGKDTKAGKYAGKILRELVNVSMDLILKKEAGLVSEETTKEIDASIAIFFKPLPGNEKADPINEIKELLIANGQKDRCKRMGVLVNELVYNRLPAPVYDEMVRRCGGWRRATFKTNWQTLSSATQKRIEDILVVAKVFIEDAMEEGPIFNFAPVIQKLDRVMPRHRSSGYCAL